MSDKYLPDEATQATDPRAPGGTLGVHPTPATLDPDVGDKEPGVLRAVEVPPTAPRNLPPANKNKDGVKMWFSTGNT